MTAYAYPYATAEAEIDTSEYERWVYETWPTGLKFAVDDEVVLDALEAVLGKPFA